MGSVPYNPSIGSIYHLKTTYSHCLLGDHISPIPAIKGTFRNSYWQNTSSVWSDHDLGILGDSTKGIPDDKGEVPHKNWLAMPWKSFATIFYRLVSEFHHYFTRGENHLPKGITIFKTVVDFQGMYLSLFVGTFLTHRLFAKIDSGSQFGIINLLTDLSDTYNIHLCMNKYSVSTFYLWHNKHSWQEILANSS